MIKRNIGIIGAFSIALVLLSILAVTSVVEVAQGQGVAPPPRDVLLAGPLSKGYSGNDYLITEASGEGIILAATIAGCATQADCINAAGTDLDITLQDGQRRHWCQFHRYRHQHNGY